MSLQFLQIKCAFVNATKKKKERKKLLQTLEMAVDIQCLAAYICILGVKIIIDFHAFIELQQ